MQLPTVETISRQSTPPSWCAHAGTHPGSRPARGPEWLSVAPMGLRYPHGRPQNARRDPGRDQPVPAPGRPQRGHLRRRPGRGRHPARFRGGRRRPRAARRRGRNARGPRARDARQREPPDPAALRPLRQPGRRGRLPPVVALADGAGGRPRAGRRALGVRLRARPRPPRRRVPRLVAHRARPRLPDLDDLRGRARAARRRRGRQGVGPPAGLHQLRPGAATGVGEARGPGRHGDDREAGRLRRPRQRDRGPPDLGRRRVHPARPQVVHLGPDERRVPRARPGRGWGDLLRRTPGAARRDPQPARRGPAQGQARQPLQRLQRAGVRRHRRAPARRRGPRGPHHHRDGQRDPPRLRAGVRRR